jgi:hypothetical protein
MITTAWYVVLPVRVRADDTRVRSEAPSADQTRVYACLHRRLKHLPQNIRITKSARAATFTLALNVLECAGDLNWSSQQIP